MKQYCIKCEHRCHCIGQGFYVSKPTCSSCLCSDCVHLEEHEEVLTEQPSFFKRLWQKYVEWVFKV